MSERVSIEALRPGMVITCITRQNGPVNIRKAGLVSSQAMVQGLAEMGVQELEIDPEQTVEIDSRLQHRTHTQQLLRGDHDKRGGADANLSEQFNRSLFLPTVQSLPTVWHRAARSAGAYVLLALLGLLLGFAGGTSHIWWPRLIQASPVQTVTTSGGADTSSGIKQDSSTQTVAESAPVHTANDNVGNEVAKADDASNQTASANNTDERIAKNTVPAESTTEKNTTSSPAGAIADSGGASLQNPSIEDPQSNAQVTYDGKVLNQPQIPSQNEVSQALLDKFNKAIEELDKNDVTGRQAQPETRVTVSQDVQRVDQLPVRVLTRLPTMKFSAHMYASNPSDRWVRVNGNQRGEGDWIADKVQIVAIEGQRVVLEFENERFSMAALTDW